MALSHTNSPLKMEESFVDILHTSATADQVILSHDALSQLPVSDGSRTPPADRFSTVSLFHSIASICTDLVLGWKQAVGESKLSEAIEIKQMVEGLSNQLFRVTLKNPAAASFSTVLFRIYGEHVSSFYNPEHELKVFKALSLLGIGPNMVANGPGWRIEEFHEDSAPLPVSSLPNPSIFTQIASSIGRLHKVQKNAKFPKNEFDTSKAVSFSRLDDWVREGLAALERLPHSEAIRERLRIPEVFLMVDKLRSVLEICEKNPHVMGNEIVFCHNDAQENNILVTPKGLRLIDFEYADFNFAFADIGNIFNEFTMDYCWPEPPMFKVDPAGYPSILARRMFASVYLSEFLDRPVMDERGEGSTMIDQLVESAEIGSQLSHLLWGFWSLVRAQQQAEETTSFDFVAFAQFRFDELLKKQETLNW